MILSEIYGLTDEDIDYDVIYIEQLHGVNLQMHQGTAATFVVHTDEIDISPNSSTFPPHIVFMKISVFRL
jgi:hypothetical protein